MAQLEVPWIAATKLSPPTRQASRVARDRLTRLLAADVPLTVVCAPAGFGKTTALCEWIDRTEDRWTWLSLDAQDNDPRRLCAHLLAGLDRVWPGAVVEAETALVGGSSLIDTVAPLTARALAERVGGDDGDLAIVLDDYHAIAEADCHRLLIALIDGLPAGARVVVSSRTPPPLRLGRRRAARAVAEIGPEQLAFRGDESKALLNGALGLELGPAQLAAIDERVDGWAAGLALVASALPPKPSRDEFLAAFALSEATVSEYLIEEALEAVDGRVRAFLLRTSILSRLCGPLCAAVLDDPEAGELLAEVRRSNLFVTVLDGEWLRYHDLFAELLRRELRATAPDLVPELHRRAAAWFERAGLPDEAIRHASLAGDGERAAGLLQAHWGELFDERRYATLRRAIADLPADRGPLGPFCEALDALCAGLDGVDLRLVARRLDALEARRDAPGVAAMIDHARMSPYYGDVGRAARDGWEIWDRSASEARAELAAPFAVVLWFAGDHDGVHSVIEPYLNAIERPRLRSWALAALSLTASDEGDAEAAERFGREAVRIAVANGGETALECHFAYVALGEALRLRGALEPAAKQLANAADLTGKVPGSLFQGFTLTFQAQLHLSAGDRGRARSDAAAARRIADGYPDTGALGARLATIETALQQGSAAAARGSRPTPAEQRVLELLAQDLTREQIASQLFVSVATIKSHIRRLYRRLGSDCRADALAVARERGLLADRP